MSSIILNPGKKRNKITEPSFLPRKGLSATIRQRNQRGKAIAHRVQQLVNTENIQWICTKRSFSI